MLEIKAKEALPVIQPNAHDRPWECPVCSVHPEYVRVFFGELSTNQILEGPIIPPIHYGCSVLFSADIILNNKPTANFVVPDFNPERHPCTSIVRKLYVARNLLSP